MKAGAIATLFSSTSTSTTTSTFTSTTSGISSALATNGNKERPKLLCSCGAQLPAPKTKGRETQLWKWICDECHTEWRRFPPKCVQVESAADRPAPICVRTLSSQSS